jgi:formate hydrogenlyase subunit 6/NADH:ubiquinone oxidoreductase subunit I
MEILKVYEERKQRDVSSSKCIHCYTCVDNCPEDGCLGVEYLNKRILCSKYKSQAEEYEPRRSRDERRVGTEA